MKLERKIVRFGNSAGVVLPKEWLNGRAKIELVEKPLNVKKDILEILGPYLEDIVGIYLVGSYARGEETKESDVDVLAISGKTAKTIVSGKYEIIISPLASVVFVLKENPEIIYPKILDAKTIMNNDLLEDLRQVNLSKNSFNKYYEDSVERIKIDRDLIEMDKNEGDILESSVVIYSVLLRLRALYMIRCILGNKKYLNKDFQRWVTKKTVIDKKEYENIYEVYRSVRDRKKIKVKIKIAIAENLLKLLEREIRKYGKKK